MALDAEAVRQLVLDLTDDPEQADIAYAKALLDETRDQKHGNHQKTA